MSTRHKTTKSAAELPPSAAPSPKIAAAGAIGTPLGLVVVWLAGALGADMPAEVGAAIGALLAAAVGYLKSNRGYLEP